MAKRLVRLLVIIAVLIGISALGFAFGRFAARVVNAQPDAAVFEETACPFTTAPNQTCGYVTVPADHDDPAAATIRLAVVVSAGDPAAAPVIVLSGGPGEITTPGAGTIAPLFQSIIGGRTLINFDQRGVGRSEPALACPEWVDSNLAGLSPTADPVETLRANNDALLGCAERLTAEGIDLSDYNSAANAADVAAIIRALGYEQADIFGVSYGALLAQHVLRDHADVVRSVIIDSVLPIDASLTVGGTDTAAAAIDRLLDACAADAACNAAFPNLRGTLFDAIDFYNANPVPITVTDPTTNIDYETLLYGDSILTSVFYFLYRTPVIPTLPEAITAIAAGNTDIAASLQSQFLGALYALERGMQFSVMCTEDLLLVTEQDYADRISALAPQYRGRADLEDLLEYSVFDLCAQWPADPLPAAIKAPVTSDLPVLALAGEFDPVTPPGYAQQVTAALPNAFTYTFPGVGHSVALASECAAGIIQQFLADPTTEPDAACIADMGVTFRVPGATLALEAFESAAFGIRGVIPAGWQELSPGVYAESATGSVVVIQQAAPVPAAQLTALLAQQFGLEAFPAPAGTREANGLTWTLYESPGPQGLLADTAVAEVEGTTYVIVLLSSDLDRAVYYDGLYLPAIDAFTAG